MPSGPRREDRLIELFLSAYEANYWTKADLDWIDRRQDGSVEVIAKRVDDEKKLAIEHTIIEPFVGEKSDFAQFIAAFKAMHDDKSLEFPDRIIRVFVPVGMLH